MATEIPRLLSYRSSSRNLGDQEFWISGLDYKGHGTPSLWSKQKRVNIYPSIDNRIRLIEKEMTWIHESVDLYEAHFKQVNGIEQAIIHKFQSIIDFLKNNLDIRGDEFKIQYQVDGSLELQTISLSIHKLILETNALFQIHLVNLDLDEHRKELYQKLDQFELVEEKILSHLVKPISDVDRNTLVLLLQMVPTFVRIKDLHAQADVLRRYLNQHGINHPLLPVADTSLMILLQSPMTEKGRARDRYIVNDLYDAIKYGVPQNLWIFHPQILNLEWLNWKIVEKHLQENHSFREVMKRIYPHQTFRYVFPKIPTTIDELHLFLEGRHQIGDGIYQYVETGIDDKPELMPDIQKDFLEKLKMPKEMVKYIVFLSGRPRTRMKFISEAVGRPLPTLDDILSKKNSNKIYAHGTTKALFTENGMTFIEPDPNSAVLVNKPYLFNSTIIENERGIFLPVLRFIKGLLPQDHTPDQPDQKIEKRIELREIGLYHDSPPLTPMCGTFYYYEPNSAFLLATNKLLIAPTKFVAAMFLLSRFKQELLSIGSGYNLVETVESYGNNKYLTHYFYTQPFAKYGYVGSIETMNNAKKLISLDMLNGRFGEGFLEIEKLPSRMKELYASEDMFDQPLCEAARDLNIPVILLTCMIGGDRVVSEVLDTRIREDSYKSIIIDSRYLNYNKLQRSQYDDIQLGLAEDYPALFEDRPNRRTEEKE